MKSTQPYDAKCKVGPSKWRGCQCNSTGIVGQWQDSQKKATKPTAVPFVVTPEYFLEEQLWPITLLTTIRTFLITRVPILFKRRTRILHKCLGSGESLLGLVPSKTDSQGPLTIVCLMRTKHSIYEGPWKGEAGNPTLVLEVSAVSVSGVSLS